MTNPELEEKLREAACFGDIEGVKELLSRGVNVNAQHDINGWTALHWAAKRNHLNIVNLLCNHGADKNIPTNKGEVAAQLTSEGVIKVLLNAMKGSSTPKPQIKREEAPAKLAITPNYIRHPALGYEVDLGGDRRPEKKLRLNSNESSHICGRGKADSELILKLRVANAQDPDFIEIELPQSALTLEYLIVMGCEELGISSNSVERVRKLPNTRLRRDREVERLADYQEVEFVLKQIEPAQANIQIPVLNNGVPMEEEEEEEEVTDSLEAANGMEAPQVIAATTDMAGETGLEVGMSAAEAKDITV